MIIFSERLRELRKARNLTQRQVFEAVGMSERGYQNHELAEREPNLTSLIKLADFFDVSIDYLVGRSDKPKRY